MEKLKNETLTDKAYEKLESMIMFQELTSDQMYSEGQIGALVGLGRTPVREALQRLAHEQLVNIIPYRGIQVTSVSVETQLKLLELRREVEKLCVRLAAARASSVQKAHMARQAELIVEYAEEGKEQEFVRMLKEIHNTITQATGNEFIKKSMIPLQILSRRFWYQHLEKNQSKVHPAHLHEKILQAIAHGNETAAEEASEALIDYLTDFTYAIIRQQGIINLPG